MGIAQEIEGDAITDLRLTDTDDEAIDNIHGVVTALSKNNSIVSVHICQDFLGCLRINERSEFLRALGKLPSLQELHLEDGLLMMADVSDMIAAANGVTALTFKSIVFQGVEKNFKDCEKALSEHGSLKDFELQEDCHAAVEGLSLDGLAQAGKR